MTHRDHRFLYAFAMRMHLEVSNDQQSERSGEE